VPGGGEPFEHYRPAELTDSWHQARQRARRCCDLLLLDLMRQSERWVWLTALVVPIKLSGWPWSLRRPVRDDFGAARSCQLIAQAARNHRPRRLDV